MAPTAMALPTTGTAMVLPTMDMAMATTPMPAMPTPMVTMDTTARGPLMPRPLLLLRLMLILTMAPMAMAWPTTDTAMDMASLTTAMPMDMPTTAMPTMDTTDIPTPPDTTDIINLLIFVKNWGEVLPCGMGYS